MNDNIISVVGGPTSTILVNDLGDADTTTIAPTIGDALTWDGTNWVPAASAGSDVTFLASKTVNQTTFGTTGAVSFENVIEDSDSGINAGFDTYTFSTPGFYSFTATIMGQGSTAGNMNVGFQIPLLQFAPVFLSTDPFTTGNGAKYMTSTGMYRFAVGDVLRVFFSGPTNMTVIGSQAFASWWTIAKIAD